MRSGHGQRNNGGALTEEERRELVDLVAEYEALALHNAKVRLWRKAPERFAEVQSRAPRALAADVSTREMLRGDHSIAPGFVPGPHAMIVLYTAFDFMCGACERNR